jgi:hypothetical protein
MKQKPRKNALTHFVPHPTACACCGREYLKRRRWQEACCRDCQLILWAAKTFIRAYRLGRADGLKPILEELKKL